MRFGILAHVNRLRSQIPGGMTVCGVPRSSRGLQANWKIRYVSVFETKSERTSVNAGFEIMSSVLDNTGILPEGGAGLLLEAVRVPGGGTNAAVNNEVVGMNSLL